MEQQTRQKIEQTVKDILSKADMEEMSEFKVRVTASELLGIDLSDLSLKKFIRELVESFLLSTVEENGYGKEPNSNPCEEKAKEIVTVNKEIDGDGDRPICKLADMTNVVVHEFRGKSYESVREFYVKNGKNLPSATGVTMAIETWSALKNSFPAIDEAIIKMQSNLRKRTVGQQNGDMSNPVTAISHEFSPIETTRFDGKNYHCWAEQMERFLKQLQIAYLLKDPYPGLNLSPEATSEELAQAEVSGKKWMNDDYLCRLCILNSLSDDLYYQFSKKAKSAKELWEELKLVYLYEEFGTKRAQVRNYLEFQIVDGKSIVEQMQELNNIADSIVASGIMVDENFHVSAIISKLPPSWKDFCIKLMREEHLPFWMLMEQIRVEESSRHRVKQAEDSQTASFHPVYNLGPRMKDMKKPGVPWKTQESEIHSKPLIRSYCGRNGHISRFCRDRKGGNNA
ncbi:basic helix-loop-helix family protein [Hibiscus syriacus]|uniref:Basic helix-loop-helix family protein n=1 Tax=Hibiscus syriacus TaxID=106335 RepID=A0A6A2ZQ14_HIBSY|nr:basic helix-loop-helix family protein [Hibiscus syriacus]